MNFDRRLLGGPLHGRVQVFGYAPFAHGYDFAQGEDGIYRFVHNGSTDSTHPIGMSPDEL